MKVSELIVDLQSHLKMFGDDEVWFNCDELPEDIEGGMIWIDGLGVYSDVKTKEHRTLLVCGECQSRAIAEKHMFDGEDESPDMEDYPV